MIKKLIFGFILISLSIGVQGDDNHRFDYTYRGMTIHSSDLIEDEEFDPNLPRKNTTICSGQALKLADEFLASVFGNDFSPNVAAVGLFRKRSAKANKYFWEWQVSYVDPISPQDARATRLITVIVSPQGKVLMELAK